MSGEGMYEKRFKEIAEVLDGALGPEQGDGMAEGILLDVMLLVQQRDAAIAALAGYDCEAARAIIEGTA